MQGFISFIWVQRTIPSHKQWVHLHPLFKIVILTPKTLEGDEIRCQYPNFATLRKNEFSRPKQFKRSKLLWSMPRPLLYRLQYRKKLGGHLKKVRRKKMFSPESMTKLEDLTVSSLRPAVPHSPPAVHSPHWAVPCSPQAVPFQSRGLTCPSQAEPHAPQFVPCPLLSVAPPIEFYKMYWIVNSNVNDTKTEVQTFRYRS